MIKNLPAKIYLQTFCDGDEGETAFEDLADVTWCAEKINESDIEYTLAQPEQETVAWGVDWGHNGDVSCASIVKKHKDGTIEVVAIEYDTKPTTPPKRKPLTDEQKRDLWRDAIYKAQEITKYSNGGPMNWQLAADIFSKSIEAAHGIKE